MNGGLRAAVLLGLVAASGLVAWRYLRAEGPPGTLVLCGGGLEFSGEHLEAAKALGELARQIPVLASVHAGSTSLKAAEEVWRGEPNDPGYEELFTKLGYKPFFVPIA